MTGTWFLRDDDTLWLIPGDSPMGLRLPLDSIPWVSEKDFPWLRQLDPSQPKLPELPKEFPYRQRFVGRAEAPTLPGQGRGQRAQKLGEKVKTARTIAAGRKSAAPARASAKARRGSSAPRCASSHATDGCTFSCRRSRRRRIISISSPASKPPSPKWARRSSSKAKRRRAIRA